MTKHSVSNTIRFYFQRKTVSVPVTNPNQTILEWLREVANCTGTKEGCAEGDCGACTVLIGQLADPEDLRHGAGARSSVVGPIKLTPVNACLQLLPTLEGRALITVEDVSGLAEQPQAEDPQLHPAQKAMIDCHGSQCGFCTPGFVMSLVATYERHSEAGTRPTRAELADDLSGNLCRCTGYRPILDAGSMMFDQPAARIDSNGIAQSLRAIAAEPVTRLSIGQERHWFAPTSAAEFAERRLAFPNATLLSGSTDIGLWVNKKMRDLGDILYVGNIPEMRRIEESDKLLTIGSAASLEDAWMALVHHWPQLQEMWLRFASPPVRHSGTLGGNVANGSPIGDGAPVLMALGARLLLRRGVDVREVSIDRFYLDYMKNALLPGEFIEKILVPLEPQLLAAYKVSKRFDSDISGVCAAFAIKLDENGIIGSARFAFGGMAAVVKRASSAEAAVAGRRWNEETLHLAQRAIGADFSPLSDLRASASYRSMVVQGLLRRFWLHTDKNFANAVAEHPISVFSMGR
jgi:xanthine dehydrogenase small subunit